MENAHKISDDVFKQDDILIRCVASNHVNLDLNGKQYISNAIWKPRKIDKDGLSLISLRLLNKDYHLETCNEKNINCHCPCKKVTNYENCSVYLLYSNIKKLDGIDGIIIEITQHNKNSAHISFNVVESNESIWNKISQELYKLHEWHYESITIRLR